MDTLWMKGSSVANGGLGTHATEYGLCVWAVGNASVWDFAAITLNLTP